MTKVGLIIGGGTGRELAEVFKRSIEYFAHMVGKEIAVVECNHQFSTYHDLQTRSQEQIESVVRQDVEQLIAFYRGFHQSGGRAIFKTAINAETLYRFRAIGKAIKTVYIPLAGKKLLFVRDEIQGFYTNDSTQFNEKEIRFSGSFSRANFQLLADYSLGEANRVLQKNYRIWVVYKHHLFANLIETWAKELLPGAGVWQPNHATDLLFEYLDSKGGQDLLMINGNEAGDILHEVLIFKLRLGTRNTLASRNAYLEPGLNGLVEYQTVHGSADGVAGKGIVNPLATLRAAAMSVEEQLREPGFVAVVDRAINAVQEGKPGHDTGGLSSTNQIVDAVLAQIESFKGRVGKMEILNESKR